MSVVVKAESIEFSFQPDSTILEGIDFQIEAGEFVAIVGPSGCGKTTLLRLLAGLISPTAGQLNFASSLRKRSCVFQDANLLPWRSAVDNVVLPLELQGVSKTEARELARSTLSATGLDQDDVSKYARELSGGMRMRVSLARALVNSPQLLLLDEPFAAVDDLTRQRLNEVLRSLWEASEWTGVLVTHNLSEAVYLSDRVWLLTGDSHLPIEEFRNSDRQVGRAGVEWKTTRDFYRRVETLTARLHETAQLHGTGAR